MITIINLTLRVVHDDSASSEEIAKAVKEFTEIHESDTMSDDFGVSEALVTRMAYSEEKPN